MNNQVIGVLVSWLEVSKDYKCNLHTNNRGSGIRGGSISDIRLCLTFKLQVLQRCEFGVSSPTSWVLIYVSKTYILMKSEWMNAFWVQSGTMNTETSWPSLIQLSLTSWLSVDSEFPNVAIPRELQQCVGNKVHHVNLWMPPPRKAHEFSHTKSCKRCHLCLLWSSDRTTKPPRFLSVKISFGADV